MCAQTAHTFFSFNTPQLKTRYGVKLTRHYVFGLWILIAFILPATIYGQEVNHVKSDTVASRNSILVYPLVFYLPETGFGGGAAAIYTFRFKGESPGSNPSQIRFSVDFTQNRQFFMQLPFEIYLREEKWKFKGELGYFNYFYFHYGIGNNTLAANRETFAVTFPRLRLDALYQFKNLYAGIRYRLDGYGDLNFKQGGIIDREIVTGRNGGVTSSAGLLFQYDTRDFIYHPTKGIFAEFDYAVNNKLFGSQFHYQRVSVNVSAYKSVAENHILAFNSSMTNMSGDVPFFDMPYFGTSNLARGFQDRRFIDRNLFVLQTEYRYPIYGRFSGVAFVSLSEVAPSIYQLLKESLKGAGGVGLRYRITKEERSMLRLDIGFTREGSALYITINDAF